MTSVPLGFWPNNLASLGWLIIVIAVLSVELIGEQLAICGGVLGLFIFFLDVLVLSPLLDRVVSRKK